MKGYVERYGDKDFTVALVLALSDLDSGECFEAWNAIQQLRESDATAPYVTLISQVRQVLNTIRARRPGSRVYPPPGVPACNFAVTALQIGEPCPTCGHSGFAHPPMSVGPCSLCLVVIEAREAVDEALDRSR